MERFGIKTVAKRRIHEAVLFEHGFSSESGTDHNGIPMPTIAIDAGLTIGQPALDEHLNFFCLHDD